MGAANRLQWFKRAAATSMMLMGGTSAAVIGPQVLDELIEEAERLARNDEDCVQVLRTLARDERPAVRALLAAAAGTLSSDGAPAAIHLLRELARDPSSHVRGAVALGVARRIARATPAERIELVCEWALSRNACERAAIARALVWPTPVLVTDLVVQQLAQDESAEVRMLALQAAAAHAHQDPTTYRRIAVERLDDPASEVRRAAEDVIEQLG
jgi:HEAT repeat protein